jgi:hypothetical protein
MWEEDVILGDRAGYGLVGRIVLAGCKQEQVKQSAVGRFGACFKCRQSVVWISRQQPLHRVHAGTNAGATI